MIAGLRDLRLVTRPRNIISKRFGWRLIWCSFLIISLLGSVSCEKDDNTGLTSPQPEEGDSTLLVVPDDFDKIGSALLESSTGDTVIVRGGLYAESDLQLPKGVTLAGWPGDTVIVDVPTGTVLVVAGGRDKLVSSFVRNLTIVAGDGKAIDVRAGASIIITNCTIRDSRNGVGVSNFTSYPMSYVRMDSCRFVANGSPEDHDGPAGPNALVLDGNIECWLNDCVFQGNIGEHGGAIYCRSELGSLELKRCIFADNSASISGGGINIIEIEEFRVYGCVFEGNSAGIWGGGVHVQQADRVVIERDCVFDGNTAKSGGAVYLDSILDARIETTNFYNNLARTGGAIFLVKGFYSISVCSFSKNGAVDDESPGCSGVAGGAIAGSWGTMLNVQSSTFYGNWADGTCSTEGLGSGSCFYFSHETSALTISSSILAFAPDGVPVSGTVGALRVSHCDVYGNEDGDWVGVLAEFEEHDASLSVDPFFCDAEAGDFRLQSDSPIILAGYSNMGAAGIGCD